MGDFIAAEAHRMSQPKTITEPTAPLEPTRALPNDELTRPRPTVQFRAAFLSGASPQPASELEAQLRKRLRASALVVVAFAVTEICISLPFALPRLRIAPWEAFTHAGGYLGIFFLIGCLDGVVAVQLSPRRPTTLARLRALEWLLVGPVLAYSGWSAAVILTASLPAIVRAPTTFAHAHCLPWSLLVVGYGVLIPNTWRRCAAMVGLILLVGYLPDVLIVLGHAVPAATAFLYLATKALWLGVAGAIVVYGAYRIEILHKEALAARKLGQYLLKQRLGAGGMGEVYLAEHVLLRRPCALKLIRPERAGDPANLLRFEREVRTTATLTHPNTVQIFDYGHADDGTFYYVMEYLPGLTLAQLVKRHGPLPAARAVHLLRQVCGALREAHAVGLIHRDIKPANVIVCERGGLHDVVKLLDFGLVRTQEVDPDGERLTQEGTLAGTPAYMSPEQASGSEALDARSDIYSVGCLAYVLLTGQPPFAGRSAVRMLAAHLYESPALLTSQCPGVTEELQAVVLRCLAKEPAERFASAGDLERALANCCTVGPWTEEEAACWWRSDQVRAMGPCAED
ncbi:MAG TPA: serine/threonine-protein kinase [Gemmataceae bacterium]|jgi:serine/threonine-protein kinase